MIGSHRKTVYEILGRDPVHPFPARMAPGIALDALGKSKRPLRVLDPMSGSGTVLAVARASGHRALGIDMDPLAVLMSAVWTRTIDAEKLIDKATEVLDRAKMRFASLASRNSYPVGSDVETRKFIRYWFDDYARRQLASLSTAIRMIRDEEMREALWCGFSRLIITKSQGASRAMDLAHSRPHKTFDRAPVKPFSRFISAVRTVTANCPQWGSGKVGPRTIVKQGDARSLDIYDATIDLVVTSPPYLNAIDYMRCSKFSLVWMGYNIKKLREIRGQCVGAEASLQKGQDSDWVKDEIKRLKLRPALSSRDFGLLSRYVWDMGLALGEAYRVLCKGGRAVYVVGDSTVRGTFVRNSSIVKSMAQRSGLSLQSVHTRNLPQNRRYLPPPKLTNKNAAMDGRIRREIVLEFSK